MIKLFQTGEWIRSGNVTNLAYLDILALKQILLYKYIYIKLLIKSILVRKMYIMAIKSLWLTSLTDLFNYNFETFSEIDPN